MEVDEPGVIQVCYDANGNGLPDDGWYEIAGSSYPDGKETWIDLATRQETIPRRYWIMK